MINFNLIIFKTYIFSETERMYKWYDYLADAPTYIQFLGAIEIQIMSSVGCLNANLV